MSTSGIRQQIARAVLISGIATNLLLLAACQREDPESAPPTVDAGPLPVITAGGSRSFVSFSHSCALVDEGVQCWGANGSGQLGDGFLTKRVPVPSRVVGLGPGVTAIAAGGSHSCAIRSGKVLCWGKNDRRQIAAQRRPLFIEPTEISGLPEPATAIAAGDEHSCAIAGGALYCWGRGTDGELGQPAPQRCGGYRATERCSAKPLRVSLPGTVTHVALGDHHSCAISDGQIHCFGRNDRGQLGVPRSQTAPRRMSDRPLPVPVAKPATGLSAGAAHTCALIAGRVHCFGAGDAGQLGNGSRHDRDSPEPVVGLEAEATHLRVGAQHSCAIAGGRVYCWGSNQEGQLGTAGDDRETPAAVVGLDPGMTALASGADHSCAVHASGAVSCWGANDFGQLGNGGNARSEPASPVAPWDQGAIRDRNGDGRITIVCLGDSNTQLEFQVERTWCERLEGLLDDSVTSTHRSPALEWETINRGWGGASATSLPSMRRAEEQLTYSLEFDSPDVIILAYGTNDLLLDATPNAILMALVQHLLRAREAGVETFIALVPAAQGQSSEFDTGVESTNALIHRAVRADRIIDFASELTPDDYLDKIHFNEAGHSKRARAAFKALHPGAAE